MIYQHAFIYIFNHFLYKWIIKPLRFKRIPKRSIFSRNIMMGKLPRYYRLSWTGVRAGFPLASSCMSFARGRSPATNSNSQLLSIIIEKAKRIKASEALDLRAKVAGNA
jgi:hypothetical protein